MRFLVFFSIIASFLLISCRKEKAIWESDWSLPLVSDTLDLKNLVSDSFLAVNGSGNYQLEINRNILDLKLSDYIEIPDTTISQKYSIASGSINVQPGSSFVNNNKDHIFDLQGAELKRVVISEGKIKITVESPIETKTIFTVKLPKAKKDGLAISKTIQAPAGSNANPSLTSTEIDLSGYELDLTGTDGGGFNLLQSQMIVKTDESGVAVNVNNYDTTKFIIEMKNIKMNYARGYFGNLTIQDTSDLYVEFLDKITGGIFDLPATNIQFIISNGIKVSARATLNSLTNTNTYSGTNVSLNHSQMGVPFTINQATGTWDSFFASIKIILFTSANSNVEQFIENLGAHQKLDFKLELNPYGNISGGWDEFFPDSKLQVLLKAQMPLSASMTNLTIEDTFDLNIDTDADKTHIIAGKLKLKVSNAFPLQGEVKMFLLDASGQLVETVSGTELIPSSVYGNLILGQLQKSDATIYFDLNANTLSKINSIKKVVVKVVLNTPEAATNISNFVLIPEGAFMAFKLGTAFQLENRF